MNDSLLGIVIIIIIIIVVVASGGAIFQNPGLGDMAAKNQNDQPIEFGSKFLFSNSSGQNYFGQNYSGQNQNQGINQGLQNIGQQLQNISYTLEKTGGPNASPHFGQIIISGIPYKGTLNEYVTLQTVNIETGILITGWKIRSAVTGNEIVIGGATNIPYPNYRNEGVIFLPKNSTVVVKAGTSPLGSFRLNKCIGYVASESQFIPNIDTWSCPSPRNELPPISNDYNDACLDYIESMPACRTISSSQFPDTISGTCKQYITTHYNYGNCVAVHKNDPDFFQNKWRVYSGKTKQLWRERRDKIQLLDASGKIVNEYAYN